MAKGLAAFVAGMGSGYLTAQQRARDQERQDKLDAQGSELHSARMDEINRDNKLRMGLADAVAPRSAQAGTVLEGGQTKEFYQDPAQVTPQLQQDRQIEADMRAEQGGQAAPAVQTSQGYGTTGMGLGNQITAQRPDVEALNSPQEQAKRIGLAYGLNGEPIKALQFQKTTEDMEQAKKDRFAKLQSEGATLAARAMLSGNPNEVFHTYNAQGKSKLKEPPKVTAEDIEMPGIGKIKNYIYSGTLIDENGQEKPFTMGSHQANMALLPYKDMMDMQRKGLEGDNKFNYQTGMLELKGNQVALQGELAAARIASAANKSSSQPTREERMRYTSLFNEAGRRMSETEKSLRVLQSDGRFMREAAKPGTPQAEQLNGLKDSIASYGAERLTYQGLLANSQSGNPPGLASMDKPKTPSIARPTTQAEHAALPKGTKYIAPNGQTYVKQ
jgi:hypothetical protein